MENTTAPQTTELNSTPTTPTRPKSLIYLILVFLLLLVGLGGFVLGKYFTETKEEPIDTTVPIVKKPNTLPTTNPTAAWKTYTNQDYNFSLSYPNEWIAELKTIGSNSPSSRFVQGMIPYLIDIKSPLGKGYFNIITINPEGYTKNIYPENIYTPVKTSNAIIDNISVIKNFYKNNANINIDSYTDFPIPKYSGLEILAKYPDDTKNIIDQILSTFRFLEKTQSLTSTQNTGTENWKTYTNKKYLFRLQYPLSYSQTLNPEENDIWFDFPSPPYPPEIVINIKVNASIPNDTLSGYVEEASNYLRTQKLTEPNDFKIIKTNKMQLGGERAILLNYQRSGLEQETIYTIHADHRYSINRFSVNSIGGKLARNEEFDQILSTFKFIE